MMMTIRYGTGRSALLILLSGLIAVLIGPMFYEGLNARAQLAAPQSPFRLVGTIEGGPFTGAVIDDTKNPQAFYRLHEKLPDESQIVKVQADHVVLKWPDGTKTELYATPGTGGAGAPAAAAAPSVAPRRVAQPTPEPGAAPNRGRAETGRPNASADGDQAAAGRRPPRMDRQNPNQQGAQAQDPNARKGGGGSRRNKPSPGSVN